MHLPIFSSYVSPDGQHTNISVSQLLYAQYSPSLQQEEPHVPVVLSVSGLQQTSISSPVKLFVTLPTL
ncbi:MAG: hypothetical protein ACOX3T_02385 [Bdellovibrionota bacterium]